MDTLYNRPRIKPIYPLYRLNRQEFRIGAQLGITAEFGDPEGQLWELASKLLLDPMEGMKLAVELFDHGNNSLKLYGMLLRNYRVAKKALLLSDMKENEILKLLGLTE